jgi:hypothetical protein
MLEVKAWMVVRDDNPVAVRFTEERASACKTLEERTYHHNDESNSCNYYYERE